MCKKVKLSLKSNVSGFIVKITDGANNLIFCEATYSYAYEKTFLTTRNRINIDVYPLKPSIYPTRIRQTVVLSDCSYNVITKTLIFSDYRYRNFFTVTDSTYGLPVKNAFLSFQS